jgi:putative addiction module component (TIGR02574 family)
MPQTADEVLTSALSLPANERGKVAASLIESLDDQVDNGADEAWAVEIRRRIDEVDEGQVKLIPWDEARRVIRDER